MKQRGREGCHSRTPSRPPYAARSRAAHGLPPLRRAPSPSPAVQLPGKMADPEQCLQEAEPQGHALLFPPVPFLP